MAPAEDDRVRGEAVEVQVTACEPFLRGIYTEWYAGIVDILPDGPGGVLELGSRPGFLGEFVSGLITSETFLCPGVRVARRPAPAFRTRRAASHSD
jgi:hypothetical protein